MQATKEPRYLEADQPFRGKGLMTLLTKAEAQHELMLLTGRDDTYEVEVIYDLESGKWTVQLHDCSRDIGRSLYHMN